MKYFSNEVSISALADFLNNTVVKAGGGVVAILDGPGTRRAFVTVVWFTQPRADVTESEPSRSKKR